MDKNEIQLNVSEVGPSSSSTSGINAQNRVGVWLNDLLGKVKNTDTKLPLLKWEKNYNKNYVAGDSKIINDSKQDCYNAKTVKTSVLQIRGLDHFDNKVEQSRNNISSESESWTKNIWNRCNFDCNSSLKNKTKIQVNKTDDLFQIKTFGEIYAKVKIQKEKLTNLKHFTSIMDTNVKTDRADSEIKTKLVENHDEINCNQNNNKLDEFSNDKNHVENEQLDDDENYKEIFINQNNSMNNLQTKLKLSELGRSSTLNEHHLIDHETDTYEFPPLANNHSSLTSSLITSTPNRKTSQPLMFSGIRRSFSDQNSSIISEDRDLLCEKSSSCHNNGFKIENLSGVNINISQNENSDVNVSTNIISKSLPIFSSSHAEEKKKITSSTCFDLISSDTSCKDARDLHLKRRNTFIRDSSYQSDSSHCSSVDSLLESRKPDAETILINLGFGPIDSEDILAKIPKRFLKPSQVRGIDTDAFLRRQQLMNSIHDHSVLGYRGLIGSPDLPPSVIVAKIMERFEQNEINRWNFCEYNRPQSAPPNSLEVQKFQYN